MFLFPTFHAKTLATLYLGFILILGFLNNDLQKLTPRGLEAIFLDVGDLNSLFLRLPDSSRILIDSGQGITSILRLPQYFSYFDRKIDLLVISDMSVETLQGIKNLLERYEVRAVIVSHDLLRTPSGIQIEALIQEQGIDLKKANTKTDYLIGTDYILDFLNLNDIIRADTASSSPLRIISKKNLSPLIFFSSFLSPKEVLMILTKGLDLHALLLKVPGGGSNELSSSSFLKNLNFKKAVISVASNNTEGYPHTSALQKLTDLAQVSMTSNQGDLQFIFENSDWTQKF